MTVSAPTTPAQTESGAPPQTGAILATLIMIAAVANLPITWRASHKRVVTCCVLRVTPDVQIG